jgi:hypothetical protein
MPFPQKLNTNRAKSSLIFVSRAENIDDDMINDFDRSTNRSKTNIRDFTYLI